MEGILANDGTDSARDSAEQKLYVGDPLLTGLIGTHIQQSRSPDMHMREARAQGIQLSYRLFDLSERTRETDALAATLDVVEQAGFSGVNITHPFKQQVIGLLDELSDDASRIGAVNTVLFRAGKRIGHNTDCGGFLESFERQLHGVPVKKAVQLGAGGAGAAAAMAMLNLGCDELAIYDPETSRARELEQRFNSVMSKPRVRTITDLNSELADADGLINATPVGMDGHPGTPVAPHLLREEMWVAEIVYFPLETQLLKDARRLGCRTANGGQMAVFQAARAFDLFTGRTANRERMLADFWNV
ncbi:MAG: shikimate dehydrogenase [Sphingomicrobium sp.]